MSLILEALKKVERERTAPEQRGFLVLGPAAWAPARSNAGWILGIVAAAAIAGGVVYALTRPAPAAPPAPAPASDRVAQGPAAPAPRVEAPPATTPEAPIRERAREAWAVPAHAAAPRTRPSAIPTPAVVPAGESAAPVVALQAISRQDGVPIAVINGHVVREGETVGGVRVLRIGPTEVEVEVAGARRIVRF